MTSRWQTVKLGSICTFENGDRGKNYPGRKSFVAQGVPFINAGHLTDSGIDMGSMDFIPKSKFDLLSNGKVLEGDVLFCLRGSLGKYAIVEGIRQGAIASSLVIIKPNELLDRRFLSAYLGSVLCKDMIEKFRNGAAQPNLSAASLKLFDIPLPPLLEQKRIAAILDEAFAGIAAATANAEKNLANARELFDSYLNSIFEQMGDGWIVKTIDEIAEVRGGKRLPKGHEFSALPTGHRYISVADFNDDGGTNEHTVRYISEKTYSEIKRYTISPRDIYISIAGTIGKTGIIPDSLDGANLTENACRLVLKAAVNNRFVYYFTRTTSFFDQALKNTRTAAQPKLALERLKTIALGLPCIEEQCRIVRKLDGLKDETRKLETIYREKLGALVDLKQSILHKAFSGELSATPEEALHETAA